MPIQLTLAWISEAVREVAQWVSGRILGSVVSEDLNCGDMAAAHEKWTWRFDGVNNLCGTFAELCD